MWSLPNSSYNNPWAGDGGDGSKRPGQSGGSASEWDPYRLGTPQQGPASSGRTEGRVPDDTWRTNGTSLEEPPNIFPELNDMTSSELEVLTHDPETFNSFVKNHAYTKRIAIGLDSLRIEVEDVRRTNEQKLNESSTTSMQSTLAESQKLEAELRQEVAKKEAQREHYLEKNSPRTMYQRLAQAVQEADDNSTKLKLDFLNGDIDYATFSKAYIAQRKLYHARSAKAMNLQEMLSHEGQQF